MAKDKICTPFLAISTDKFTVDTIEDLKVVKRFVLGDVVEVLGFHTKGDGAHHYRQKKPVGYNGADAVIGNDGSIWGIVHSGEVKVSWFGDKYQDFFDFCYLTHSISVIDKKVASSTRLVIKSNVLGNYNEISDISILGNDIEITKLNIIGETAISLVLGSSATTLKNVKISDCEINNVYTDTNSREAIIARNVENLKLVNNKITYGTNLINCTDYLIQGNFIDGDDFKNNSELIHATLKSWGIINANTFKNAWDDFIDLYSSGERTIITNNKFLGSQFKTSSAIEIKVSLSDDENNTSSVKNGYDRNIIIANNVFYGANPRNNVKTQWISVFYINNSAVKPVLETEYPRNILIDNNLFNVILKTSNLNHDCIGLDGAVGVSVTNNIIDTELDTPTGVTGILLKNVKDVIVSGNNMKGLENCFRLSHRLDNVKIINNNVYGSFGIVSNTLGSVYIPSSVENLILSGNKFKNSLYSIQFTGGDIRRGVIENNLFDNCLSFQELRNVKIIKNFFVGSRLDFSTSIALDSSEVDLCGNSFDFQESKRCIVFGNCKNVKLNTNTFKTSGSAVVATGTLNVGAIKNNIVEQSGGVFPVISGVGNITNIIKSDNIINGTISVVALDTPYHTSNMQKLGILDSYHNYLTELHEYEKQQNTQTDTGVMNLNVIQPPIIPTEVEEYAKEYNLI